MIHPLLQLRWRCNPSVYQSYIDEPWRSNAAFFILSIFAGIDAIFAP
jgi:hypothetical protein